MDLWQGNGLPKIELWQDKYLPKMVYGGTVSSCRWSTKHKKEQWSALHLAYQMDVWSMHLSRLAYGREKNCCVCSLPCGQMEDNYCLAVLAAYGICLSA